MIKKAYKELSSSDKGMFVVVAGNIGCGKTTLTRKLAEKLSWKPYFESVQDNPYLADFYDNMQRWSFPLQIYFLNHRFKTHRHIQEKQASAIQDRSIYEDANIFARALFEQKNMDERDYENYLNLYGNMTDYLTPPDLMIFLKRSLPKLQERIALRGRDYEQSIPVDYLARLNDYYHDWYERYDLGKSITIDTDELDFLNNEEHFDSLIGKIYETMDQGDMLLNNFMN